MSTRSKKNTTAKKTTKKSANAEKEPQLSPFEIDYFKGLDGYANLFGMDRDAFQNYLTEIYNDIQESITETIPNMFEHPQQIKDAYSVIGHLTELYGFYEITPDDIDPHSFAKETFVNSFIEQSGHISRENPTLIEDFKKLDSFRNLETTVEGQEDIGVCSICSSKKINVKIKGTRSADEALTVIYTCSNCKASGKNIHLFSKDEREKLKVIREKFESELETLNKETEAKINSGEFFREQEDEE